MSARTARRPGRLRHRLTIETPSLDPDGGGGGTRTWTPVATVWAAIAPLRGDRRRLGEGIAEAVTHRVTLRYRDDVSTGDRFVLGTRVFDIRTAYDPDETGAWLVCDVVEEG